MTNWRNYQGSPSTWGKSFALMLLAIMLVSTPPLKANAHSYKVGSISVGHMWARPTEVGQVISVYGPIFKTSGKADRITRITTSKLARSGVCTLNDKGALKWIDPVIITPGKVLAFAEWRERICIKGLDRSLGAAESFKLKLEFENAGTVNIDVLIETEGGHR